MAERINSPDCANPCRQPSSIPKLDTRLAAQDVLQMANLPIEANMLFTTLLPTRMPFVGRG